MPFITSTFTHEKFHDRVTDIFYRENKTKICPSLNLFKGWRAYARRIDLIPQPSRFRRSLDLSTGVQHFPVISADIYHTHFFTALARNVLKRFFSALKLRKLEK